MGRQLIRRKSSGPSDSGPQNQPSTTQILIEKLSGLTGLDPEELIFYGSLVREARANWPALIQAIQEIGQQADQKRATVLVETFKTEYPDLYSFISDLVDVPAADARTEIIRRWPWMMAMMTHRGHLGVIEFFQQQIKLRRE